MIVTPVAKRTYYTVFAVLLALLLATVGAAFVHLGPFNLAIALAIAGCKALLIIFYFMHVRGGTRMLWIFAGAGFFWLGILFTLVLTDYVTRGW